MPEKGEQMLDRGGLVVGTVTGGQYPCRMEGCGGMRIAVKWPDDKVTYPCSKAIHLRREHVWQIV